MNLTDHEKLVSVKINPGESAFFFHKTTNSSASQQLASQLDSDLNGTQTAAFLIIRNDTILYERYFNGFNEHSLLPSNSLSKSFVSTLIGIAIDEGHITSLSQPVSHFLPELQERDSLFSRITLKHLIDMRSGLNYTEGTYTLKDDGIRIAFRPNLEKHILKIKIAEPPGKFKYQSINTMLLGLVLERATKMSLSKYLEMKIWKPMGFESYATWNADSKKRKQEIISSGLNATARDFAKLGRLVLNRGDWDGKKIIRSEWFNSIINLDSMHLYEGYKGQWWNRLVSRYFDDSLQAETFKKKTPYATPVIKEKDGYRVELMSNTVLASGFLNQIIFIVPEKKLLIIRLGQRFKHQETFQQFIYNTSLLL